MSCPCPTPKARMANHRACATCGARACPAFGVFLVLLYAGQTFCTGCGRRSVHCTCRVL